MQRQDLKNIAILAAIAIVGIVTLVIAVTALLLAAVSMAVAGWESKVSVDELDNTTTWEVRHRGLAPARGAPSEQVHARTICMGNPVDTNEFSMLAPHFLSDRGEDVVYVEAKF